MRLLYRLSADLVVTIHIAYVAFIVVGLFVIIVGATMRRTWARNATFRLLHLAAIVFVALEAMLGITCPLTAWEQRLRRMAGEATYSGGFIANWMHDILFMEGEPWMFTLAYCLIATVVGFLFLLAPPTRRESH